MTVLLELLPESITDVRDVVSDGDIGDRNCVVKAPDRDYLAVPSTSWLRGSVPGSQICHSLVGKGPCDTVGRCCMDRDNRAKHNKCRSCVSEETHGG